MKTFIQTVKKSFRFVLSLALILFFSSVLSACDNDIQININSTKKDTSKVVTKSFKMKDITIIKLGASVDVDIVEGSENSNIQIIGPEYSLSKLNKTIKSGVWNIKFSRDYNKYCDNLRIIIPSSQIEEISVSGSGDVVSTVVLPIKELSVSGSGSIKTKVLSETLESTVIGSGDIIISGNVNTLDATVTGSGLIKADVSSERIISKVSGSGDVKMSGVTNDLMVTVAGSGDFSGFNLKAKDATVTVKGSGDAGVFSENTLDVSIKGSGDVVYTGNPEITKHIVGSGDLSKR